MKLLADENFPAAAVYALRAVGHDVTWVRTEIPGAPDPIVVALAASEDRLLLTFDKDFGELAFSGGLTSAAGVVLFRLQPTSPDYLVTRVVETLASRDDWSGHFSVVEDDRIRMRPLPN